MRVKRRNRLLDFEDEDSDEEDEDARRRRQRMAKKRRIDGDTLEQLGTSWLSCKWDFISDDINSRQP